jgi:hypothetical protein
MFNSNECKIYHVNLFTVAAVLESAERQVALLLREREMRVVSADKEVCFECTFVIEVTIIFQISVSCAGSTLVKQATCRN